MGGWQRQELRGEGIIPPKMAEAPPPSSPQGLQVPASSADASPPLLCLQPCLENEDLPGAVILVWSHQTLQSDRQGNPLQTRASQEEATSGAKQIFNAPSSTHA